MLTFNQLLKVIIIHAIGSNLMQFSFPPSVSSSYLSTVWGRIEKCKKGNKSERKNLILLDNYYIRNVNHRDKISFRFYRVVPQYVYVHVY